MIAISRRTFVGSALALAGGRSLGARPAPRRPGQALVRGARAVQGELRARVRATRTRFAINLEIWWSELPFLERVRQAAAHGFRSVEFWPYENKDLDELARTCRELDLEIAQFTAWGFEPGMNDPAHHDAVEQKIREACAVAQRLGCRKMTVVGGNDQPGMTQETMHRHIVGALKRVAPIAEGAGVILILEPMNVRVDHKGHCLYGSEKAVRIRREVNSPAVKVNWDLYHMQLSEGDLCGHLRDGIDQLAYVQVADTPGRHEPGTGEVSYGRVLRELHELGYREAVGLECWPREDEAAAIERILAADAA
jgi:hydroxypyruvate isomerase